MDPAELEKRLLEVISDIAEGRYSNDIMELTRDEVPEAIRTIAEAVALMMVKVEAREFRLQQLVEELKELNEQVRNNTVAVVTAMAHALAARDSYTEGHASRVSELAHAIGREMGLTGEELEYVRLGGALHDIGKIGFPDILFASHEGKLPSDLVKEINRHPSIGAKILKPLDFLGPAVDYVSAHHERLDGRGYPRGLKEGRSRLGARSYLSPIFTTPSHRNAPTRKRELPRRPSRSCAVSRARASGQTSSGPWSGYWKGAIFPAAPVNRGRAVSQRRRSLTSVRPRGCLEARKFSFFKRASILMLSVSTVPCISSTSLSCPIPISTSISFHPALCPGSHRV
jgi:putative nucleotidyltransferase with HDIG domain